jgi:ribonuclease-3
VLALVVSETLYRRYPQEDEGALTAGCTRWCAGKPVPGSARISGLGSFDFDQGGSGRRASRGPILGSALEAVIAAILSGRRHGAARGFIARLWEPMFSDPGADTRDAKTRLQEWSQSRGKASAAPVYALRPRTGPTMRRSLSSPCKCKGYDPVAGEGGSKRQAEQDAAAKLAGHCRAEKLA